MIQDIADDGWITRPAVMRNLATAARSGLRFDALVHTRHLPYLIQAIQPVPDLVVVIDHLAKPDYSTSRLGWVGDDGEPDGAAARAGRSWLSASDGTGPP